MQFRCRALRLPCRRCLIASDAAVTVTIRVLCTVTGMTSGSRPGGPLNVLGGALATCSMDPLTGWLRDGCCTADPRDAGRHHVCVVLTEAFLTFSRERGNDLSTPRPEFGFPGLKEGDRWCLCALRWEEARRAGVAPQVVLEATALAALEVLQREHLLAHGVSGSGS